MKIVLVLMPWYRRESPAPEFAMTVSLLKEDGHRVFVFDINNRIFNDQFFLRKYWKFFLTDAPKDAKDEFSNLSEDVFCHYASEILSFEPDLVIFKIIGKTYYNSIEMAKVIKKKDKDKAIIFTGALIINEEEVEAIIERQDEEPFDYIICGEDEVALSELVRSIGKATPITLNHNGKVINCINGPVIQDLDSLPYYDFSDFNLSSFRYPEKLEIFISKGCIWRCNFCVDWLTEKRYRSMSGERIYREVAFQVKTNKTTHFRFCDKTINGNIKAINDFCDLMLEDYHRNNSLLAEWSGDAMIRPEMTKELLLKMHQAGCRGLGYGLESGSDRVLKTMNKQFSIAVAEEVIKNTRLASIYTSINIMIGFPSETEADFQDTLEFIERNREFIHEIRLTYLGCRIYKHSILHSFPERFNVFNVDEEYWLTKDGQNTYGERLRRYEIICKRIPDLGIELRVNSRVTKKAVKAD